ncbi:MAG: hypothetical protein BAJALOKI1v1_50028 [Promethearchaeota archaeon]|nr:MAG: hypothetical protein BAJALOKI1v1_50028 [Candidatus Lokiarchaeota archaeon]
MEWIGKKFIPSQKYRESEEKSLEFYREYKRRFPRLGWFVDARNVKSVSTDDMQWVTDVILPESSKLGLQKEAFVVPESAITQLVINNYKAKSGSIIEIEAFSSEREAKKWLKQ